MNRWYIHFLSSKSVLISRCHIEAGLILHKPFLMLYSHDCTRPVFIIFQSNLKGASTLVRNLSARQNLACALTFCLQIPYFVHVNSLVESDNMWQELVNIGSGNGLLPDGSKLLPKSMLTYCNWNCQIQQLSFAKNALENVVCKLAAISIPTQCAKRPCIMQARLFYFVAAATVLVFRCQQRHMTKYWHGWQTRHSCFLASGKWTTRSGLGHCRTFVSKIIMTTTSSHSV